MRRSGVTDSPGEHNPERRRGAEFMKALKRPLENIIYEILQRFLMALNQAFDLP